MSPKALISVIVPCYKQAAYLPEALESVLAQTYADWECIIVDDGSPDETAEVAEAWCRKDPRFRLVRKTNGGLCSARNAGIAAASGEYILPLDGDDRISPDYLEGCLALFTQTPSIKVAYGSAVYFGARNEPWDLPPYTYDMLLTRNIIYCTALFRKADWTACGGYDEKMRDGLEDWDFWLALLNENDRVARNEAITFYYRIKADSMLTSLVKDPARLHATHRYLYRKHEAKMIRVMSSPMQLYLENEELKRELGLYTARWEKIKRNPATFILRSLTEKLKNKITR